MERLRPSGVVESFFSCFHSLLMFACSPFFLRCCILPHPVCCLRPSCRYADVLVHRLLAAAIGHDILPKGFVRYTSLSFSLKITSM